MKWLIIGGGISGVGAAKLLRKNRYDVVLTDAKKIPTDRKTDLLNLGVTVEECTESLDLLNGITDLIVSPGVYPTNPLILAAKERQIKIKTEIDLALTYFKGTLIGVTGTNGKSTTCVMIEHILKKSGRKVKAGGNLGDALSLIVAGEEKFDIVVAELSSYQLEQSHLVRPKVAIITSLSEDHLKRHGTMKEYGRVKWRIFEKQDNADLAIMPSYIYRTALEYGLAALNGEVNVIDIEGRENEFEKAVIPKLARFRLKNKALLKENGKEGIDFSKTKIKEKHNQLNATFSCLCAAKILKEPLETTIKYLSDFKGLPHRMEYVASLNKNPIINDSKATNVESTLVALESCERPVILWLGGEGKGESFSPIINFREKIVKAIIFGHSAGQIISDLAGKIPFQKYSTLAEAFSDLHSILKDLEYPVLFSPGCASFDEFNNFEERGNYFKSTVRAYLVFRGTA